MADKIQIENALKTVKYPGFSRDIVSFGLLQAIECDGDQVTVRIAVTTADDSVPQRIKEDAEAALKPLDGIASAIVEVAVQRPNTPPPPAAAAGKRNVTGPAQQAIPGVKHIVAVASGKGGVGKSTFAVNLACAFQHILGERQRDAAIGLMDCDIYGPSVPLMIGVNTQPTVEGQMIMPVENFGIKVMSMGLLVDENTPVVWRGPMIMKTIQQFAANVSWGELDLLVVDLPPGTGDAQLSLVQTLPLSGAIIVTTPQPAAANVTRRGALMFDKVNVPILGVAENMSYLEAADGSRQRIFGEGGGSQSAQYLECDFLGEVPLDPRIREGGDHGIPVVVSNPDIPASRSFLEIARRVLDKLKS